MKTIAAVLFWIVWGVGGLMAGFAGHPVGWFFAVCAVWSIVATIRHRDDAKDGSTDSGAWFDFGGCGGGGCGGCGGCGG